MWGGSGFGLDTIVLNPVVHISGMKYRISNVKFRPSYSAIKISRFLTFNHCPVE